MRIELEEDSDKLRYYSLGRNVSQELYDVSKMVLILAVAGSRVRLEQEVPSSQLECHAGCGPDIGWSTIARPLGFVVTLVGHVDYCYPYLG